MTTDGRWLAMGAVAAVTVAGWMRRVGSAVGPYEPFDPDPESDRAFREQLEEVLWQADAHTPYENEILSWYATGEGQTWVGVYTMSWHEIPVPRGPLHIGVLLIVLEGGQTVEEAQDKIVAWFWTKGGAGAQDTGTGSLGFMLWARRTLLAQIEAYKERWAGSRTPVVVVIVGRDAARSRAYAYLQRYNLLRISPTTLAWVINRAGWADDALRSLLRGLSGGR